MRTTLLCFLALIYLSACHNHGHEHEHEADELEPLVYTIYTDKTELFLEFKPLIVGEEARFAAHFTALGESFKAIGKGTISLSLGSQTITSDKPEIPGIFRLRLTPKTTGMYKLVFDIKTPAFTDNIVIDSVFVYADKQTAMKQNATEEGGGNGITYLKEQAWNIYFANSPVIREPFYSVVKTSGLVSSAPGDEQTVAAKTAGVVSLNTRGLYEGQSVTAGQSLFSISSKGLTENNADVRLQEAKSNYEKSKADYERNQKLLADKLITQKDFLQSKVEYENAQAIYNSLGSNYGQGGQLISATQGGFVKSLLVTQGQFVEVGQPLAVISQNKRLTVKAELSQTAFSKIGSVTSANFKTGSGRVYSLQELNGRLVSVGKTAGNSLFIAVYFEIDNKEGIIPGTYMEVFVKTDALSNALVIPTSALMEEQGEYYCYVQVEGESFEKRPLVLAGNDGKQVQVVSGLNEGDRVVTKGAYNIKLSVASGTLPAHGHEH